MKIAWVLNSTDFLVASTRFRAIYPAMFLAKLEHSSKFYVSLSQLTRDLDLYDVVIIIKRLDPEIISLVSSAYDDGKAIFIDFCDNILELDYRKDRHNQNRMVFNAIDPYLTGIITTTSALSDNLQDYGIDSSRLMLAPDTFETPALIDTGKNYFQKHLLQPKQTIVPKGIHPIGVVTSEQKVMRNFSRIKKVILNPVQTLIQMREIIRESTSGQAPKTEVDKTSLPCIKGKTVVWFGNHGSPNSDFGQLTILRVAKQLKAVYDVTPFTLVVISNSKRKYKSFLTKLGISTKYIEWSPDVVGKYLKRANACLLTVGLDKFSQSKSSNRAITALSYGVPVVAQNLGSINNLREYISIDDVENGLLKYLQDDELSKKHVAEARLIISNSHSPEYTGNKWLELISVPPAKKERPQYNGANNNRVLIVLDLIQDIDIALPIIDGIRGRNVDVAIITSERLAQKTNRLSAELIKRDIVPTMISNKDLTRNDFRWLRGATAVFTVAETNHNAHKFAHYIVKIANQIGVPTFTVQHGFENIGLTYRENQDMQIQIASQTIFTWRSPEKLPNWVNPDIASKCVGVGRISLRQKLEPLDVVPFDTAKQSIGVFENLHWDRYSDAYRDSFITNVRHVGNQFPEIQFIIKPHPAGRWLTKQGKIPNIPNNVVMADQLDINWENCSTSALLPYLSGVITTPSSIAVDAAENDLSVAIIANEIDGLEIYAPLPLLKTTSDWSNYVKTITQNSSDYRQSSSLFLERTLEPSNATELILNEITNTKPRRLSKT